MEHGKVFAEAMVTVEHGRYVFKMFGYQAKIAEIVTKYGTDHMLELVIDEPDAWKTGGQRGYLYGYLAGLALNVLRDDGWVLQTRHQAVELLKENLGWTVDYHNRKTGEIIESRPRSVAAAKKRELSEFIQMIMLWLVERGIEVHTPEEYKQAKKIEKA